ncbi:sensor histidine kinase [Undibacterium sp. TJN19]|uniref:sensor histidine kinase n=1 Tax=Undibacterium sp. TJN19 TaxID=3413055 RepID=UPI003BF3EACE
MEKARPDTQFMQPKLVSAPVEVMRLLFINILIWTSMCAVGALGNYSDVVKHGSRRTYADILWNWISSHMLMMVFSTCLFMLLRRSEKLLSTSRGIAIAYGLMLVFFLPVEILYVHMLDLLKLNTGFGFQEIWQGLFNFGGFGIFLEFAWSTGTFIAVLATCTWRQGRVREQALQQSMNDVLHLQLDLQEQRLQALRGQLEPHFIFNCLNAISALVRSDDKRIALSGLNRLSDLLRYALTASSRDWVSIEDELDFIRDYLDLQRLRYGTRLQVSIKGDDASVLAGDCPPLLLQPLLENALRHDLDCHEAASDICMRFTLEGEQLCIQVSNAVTDGLVANPGLGLGLPQTQARLQLIYGDAASMHSGRIMKSGKTSFEVEIHMPLHMPESEAA